MLIIEQSQQTSVIVPTPVASSAASSATSVLVPTPASSVPASSVAVAGSSSAVSRAHDMPRSTLIRSRLAPRPAMLSSFLHQM